MTKSISRFLYPVSPYWDRSSAFVICESQAHKQRAQAMIRWQTGWPTWPPRTSVDTQDGLYTNSWSVLQYCKINCICHSVIAIVLLPSQGEYMFLVVCLLVCLFTKVTWKARDWLWRKFQEILTVTQFIWVLTPFSTLYGSYHEGQFHGQRKQAHTVGEGSVNCLPSVSNRQLSHIGSGVRTTNLRGGGRVC